MYIFVPQLQFIFSQSASTILLPHIVASQLCFVERLCVKLCVVVFVGILQAQTNSILFQIISLSGVLDL